MMNSNDTYSTPLGSRYASEEMLRNFSPNTRYSTWRRLWVALAEAEMECGLDITPEQVEQLRAHTDDIDYDAVSAKEKETERPLTDCRQKAKFKFFGNRRDFGHACSAFSGSSTGMYTCSHRHRLRTYLCSWFFHLKTSSSKK